MAKPTPDIVGIVRHRSAMANFTYSDGSYFPYGGRVSWYVDGTYVGASNYKPYATTCDGITITGLTPGTMYTVTINLYIYDANGIPQYAGQFGVTMTTLSRPAAFAWTVPKVAGGQYYVGASEWVGLVANILNVLEYAGYSYTFKTQLPSPGDLLTAERYNDLRAAVQSVPGYGYYIPQVARGQVVTAQQLNLLVSELNAIP